MKNIRHATAIMLLFTGIATVHAQSANEIIKKHIKAIGGEKKWERLNSIKITGTINVRGADMGYTRTVLNGKGERQVYSYNGQSSFEILTPTHGWSYAPQAGRRTRPEDIPDIIVKQSQSKLDIQDPLVNYKAKGSKVAYTGKGKADGTDCYKIELTPANGTKQIMYISTSSYYLVRVTQLHTEGGKTDEEEIAAYSDYQKLPGGIVFPMNIAGDAGDIKIKNVEVNIPVVDSIVFNPSKY